MFEGVGTRVESDVASGPCRFGDAMVLTGELKNMRHVLALLLERSGMTQAEAARRLGTSKQYICQVVAGQRSSVKVVAELAAVCGGRVIVELP